MAIGDVWKVAVTGTYDGQLVVMTSHFKALSAGATGDGAAAAWQSICTFAQASASSSCQLTARTSMSLTVPPSVTSTTISSTGAMGATAGIPTTSAIVVSEKTGFAGRSYRGRFYVPGLQENSTENGSITSSDRSGFQTLMNTAVATYGASGTNPDYQWGVFSRHLGEIRDGSGNLTGYDLTKFFPITSVTVRAALGTQRRRRVGVGA